MLDVDHGLDPELGQPPDRMLAAGAAPEVGSSDPDLGILVTRLVQDELGSWGAVGLAAQVEQQALGESGLSMPCRNCLGMIWSVSQLDSGSGAARPWMVLSTILISPSGT